ncbi:hypothetical protein U9M48_004705 [Paspalum notatum var. saurae]|uniref:KIB1-4 beta-propeller domain-containing protein n=1 Tax=Paspalum notatum var. saurae TaxID=547442 RepID=A0AAQ3PV97_PASNO
MIMNPIASVSVSSSTGAVTVMLALGLLRRVAYATTGDQQWSISSWTIRSFIKPMSCNGKLYVVQYVHRDIKKVHICQIDPPSATTDEDSPLPVKIFAECPMDRFIYNHSLAECGSELFLVAATDASRTHLSAYRLADLVVGRFVPVRLGSPVGPKWMPKHCMRTVNRENSGWTGWMGSLVNPVLTSIGDYALFLGERSLYVPISPNEGSRRWLPSSISPNSVIYLHFSSPHFEGKQQGHARQYNLGSGMGAPASDGSIADAPPPSPYTLIHHIFTCCFRNYWTYVFHTRWASLVGKARSTLGGLMGERAQREIYTAAKVCYGNATQITLEMAPI